MLAGAVQTKTIFVVINHQARIDFVDISNIAAECHRAVDVVDAEGCGRAGRDLDKVSRLPDRNDFLDRSFLLHVNRQAVSITQADRRDVYRLCAVDRDPVRAARQQASCQEDAAVVGRIRAFNTTASVFDYDSRTGERRAALVKDLASDRRRRVLCV